MNKYVKWAMIALLAVVAALVLYSWASSASESDISGVYWDSSRFYAYPVADSVLVCKLYSNRAECVPLPPGTIVLVPRPKTEY